VKETCRGGKKKAARKRNDEAKEVEKRRWGQIDVTASAVKEKNQFCSQKKFVD
jgi:hypothetical protein